MAAIMVAQPASYQTELQASRVYTRTSDPAPGPASRRRRAVSFSSAAAIYETSCGSSLTLLDSKASTHHSSQRSTIYVPSLSSADHHHTTDATAAAALQSFRSPSLYSLISTAGRLPLVPSQGQDSYNTSYASDIHSLPRPLGRPLPAANPPAARARNLNFSAQRARPRSLLQPFTLAELRDRTSLLKACQYGNTARVAALLAQGVDPNTRETAGWHCERNSGGQGTGTGIASTTGAAAAIHIATMAGHYDVVRCLLHHGARVDEPFQGFRRPLHEAVRRGDGAMTGLLLDNGAAVEARDERGYQPLHVAVMADKLACAKLLVWANAPVNSVGNDFLTPLHHLAMGAGNLELVDLLIEHGADIFVRTRWLLGNKLASELAREKGNLAMESRLISLERLT